jgi:hypothetical protein
MANGLLDVLTAKRGQDESVDKEGTRPQRPRGSGKRFISFLPHRTVKRKEVGEMELNEMDLCVAPGACHEDSLIRLITVPLAGSVCF